MKSDRNIFAYKRKLNDQEIVVVSNFTKKSVKVPLIDKLKGYEIVIGNYKKNDSNVLKPYETRVYKNY